MKRQFVVVFAICAVTAAFYLCFVLNKIYKRYRYRFGIAKELNTDYVHFCIFKLTIKFNTSGNMSKIIFSQSNVIQIITEVLKLIYAISDQMRNI